MLTGQNSQDLGSKGIVSIEPKDFEVVIQLQNNDRYRLIRAEDLKTICDDIGGEPEDKDQILNEIKNRILKKDGVYWGRVCNGNYLGTSPVDNPDGCFHSFVMTIGDNGVTIYQTMQGAFTLNSKFGIVEFENKDWFAGNLTEATTETSVKGPNHAFHKLFWYDPNEEHTIKQTGAPQVVLNGPIPDACSAIPRLTSFDFVKGKHNWGEKAIHPNKQKVDWPVLKVHNANTMGNGGIAEGGWMKGSFCMNYEAAEECEEIYSPKLCNIM